MPRENVVYQNTVIYKIICKDIKITDLYVGNTTNFTNRKNSHKRCSIDETLRNSHFKVYKIIRENGGWCNWEMIEVEKYPCKDSNEARARERYWYDRLNAELNTNKPLITIEEKRLNALKFYYDNVNICRERNKNWKIENTVYVVEYNTDYHQENMEHIKQRKQDFYHKVGKIECECGRFYSYGGKFNHLNTKIHKRLMNDL